MLMNTTNYRVARGPRRVLVQTLYIPTVGRFEFIQECQALGGRMTQLGWSFPLKCEGAVESLLQRAYPSA